MTAKHSSLEGDPQQEGLGLRPVPLRGRTLMPLNVTPSGPDAPLPSEFEVPLGSSCSSGRGLHLHPQSPLQQTPISGFVGIFWGGK